MELDASAEEVAVLARTLPVTCFVPVPGQFPDGEVANIDELVASAAKAFVGTQGSTFTDVIMEERALAGDPLELTWRVLCVRSPLTAQGAPLQCTQPAPPLFRRVEVDVDQRAS